MAKGYSIHIGLNRVDPVHYQGWSGDLVACEADANDMAELAGQQGFETLHVLLTADATSEQVLGALDEAAAKLQDGDLLFLTYSGHGGQIPDVSGDEKEELDETWVLFDRQVLDDELYARYRAFAGGVRIFVLSDSCHSGTVIRELPDFLRPEVLEAQFGSTVPEEMQKRVRAIPRAVELDTYKANQAMYDAIGKDGGETGPVAATVALISGCHDNQTSADGDRNGLFTEKFKATWAGGNFRTYRGLQRKILAQMPPNQSPYLFAYGADVSGFLRQRPLTV